MIYRERLAVEIEAIKAQHDGWHMAQPCLVGMSTCDVQTLLAEIARLRKIEEAARAVHDRYSEDVRLPPSWTQMAALRAALDHEVVWG